MGVGRVRVFMLCVGNNDQRERGVGVSVNATRMSETLQVVGLTDIAQWTVWLRKKTLNLCTHDN